MNKKVIAIIAHTMQQFQNWAMERRINRVKSGSNRFVDLQGDEYIPIVVSDFNARYKLNGLRIDEYEDITFEWDYRTTDIINYCISRRIFKSE